jgi:hypothetical protein
MTRVDVAGVPRSNQQLAFVSRKKEQTDRLPEKDVNVPSGYFCVGRRKYEVRINPSTVRTCRSRFHRRGTGVGRFGISTAWMFNECTHRHLVYYPQWRDTDGPTHSGHLKNDKRWRPVAVGVGRVVGMISLEGEDSHIVREATM